MSLYYTPSGKSSPISIFFFFGLVLVILPLLALAYSYAIWYIPFIYINFIITAAFGVITGFLVKFVVIKLGKVRNPTISVVFGILAGIAAWYFQWVVYVDLLLNTTDYMGNERMGVAISTVDVSQTIALAGQPGFVFEIMGFLFDYGSWGLFGFTISGIFLALVWIAEFGIIVFLSSFMGVETAKKPFCESTNKWFDEEVIGPFEYIYEKPQLKEALEAGSSASFDALVPTKNDQANHSLFYLYSSSQGENYLTVENKRANLSNGEIEWSEEQFVEAISISEPLKQSLLAKAGNTQQ